MDSLAGNGVDITLALQTRLQPPPRSAQSQGGLKAQLDKPSENTAESDDAKARDAANKFEALLIHNLLKNMRKTTMSEGKSNDRAIYDDMFDEKLADTMMEAGGIGVADQILAQIRQQQGKETISAQPDSSFKRLRELAVHIHRPADEANFATSNDVAPHINSPGTDIGHLRLAKELWSNSTDTGLTDSQRRFVQSLSSYAKHNANRLGTTPDAIIAVAALETGWGKSTIKDKNGRESHNLFGIKATGSDNSYATTLTTEYIEGRPQKLQARFKTYDSPADAVNGFADFILSNPRYSQALKFAGNPEKFLQELQNAGYATDPRYANKAISIMRQIAGNALPL